MLFFKLFRLNNIYLMVGVFIIKSCFCHNSNIFIKESKEINFNYEDWPNVRTVLFDKQDITKTCWIIEDLELLVNRYIFQILLPVKIPNDMVQFFYYMSWCFDIVNNIRSKKVRRILLNSLSDTFGGYLHAYALPTVKEEYYEGLINYPTAEGYYDFQKMLKNNLKTDGKGWANPITINEPIKPVKKFTISSHSKTSNSHQNCHQIIIENKDENIKSKKKEGKHNITDIPLPFFDDCKDPHAIAVPLKGQNLYSLTSNRSIGVLKRYYIISLKCITEKCKKYKICKTECKNNINQFNLMFFIWMSRNIIPHLNDDKWYPGFYESVNLYKTSEALLNGSKEFNELGVNYKENKSNKYFKLMTILIILISLLGLLIFFSVCDCRCRRSLHTENSEWNKDVSSSCLLSCTHGISMTGVETMTSADDVNDGKVKNSFKDYRSNISDTEINKTNNKKNKKEDSLPVTYTRHNEDVIQEYVQAYFFEVDRSIADSETSENQASSDIYTCHEKRLPSRTVSSSSNSQSFDYTENMYNKSYRKSKITKIRSCRPRD